MDVYGLIHSRYILTSKGLNAMKDKFNRKVFGVCPRIKCERCSVLPIGLSEDLSISRVKVYCPKCHEVYVPRMKFLDIDGAYFGCSFPHIFLKTFYKDLNKENHFVPYIPRIYGFKLFNKKGSKYYGKSDDLINSIYSKSSRDYKIKSIHDK